MPTVKAIDYPNRFKHDAILDFVYRTFDQQETKKDFGIGKPFL